VIDRLAFVSEFPQNPRMPVRFGAFVFDSRRHMLTRNGEPVELSPKAFLLVEMLIDARHAAVSKELLYERLWPKTFVEPGNLHNLVSEIRSALGDGDRKIVKTVHGFGYVFAAESSSSDIPARFGIRLGRELIRLYEGANVIGRDPAAAVVLDAPDVSREHARLFVRGDSVTLEDLGSKNGTFVGRMRIRAATVVHEGDEILVGRTRIVVQTIGSGASTLTL
jgi:DNA-binding winged helix-turn-helix (wHTH) protein